MATAEAEVSHNHPDDTGLTESMNQINLGDRDDGPPKTEAEYSQSQLTLRAIVSSKEAGVIIGKAGKNVADLRDETGVKAGVSKVVPGVHDRVLTVTGELQGISKAYAIVAKGLLEGAPQMGMGGVISNNGTHRTSLPPPSARWIGLLLLLNQAIYHHRLGSNSADFVLYSCALVDLS
jgi:heterogeneous nuclear rnp K-like protein 2